MRHNLFALLVGITLVAIGLTSKTQYGPCRKTCEKLKLGKCSRVCRIAENSTIWNSCWKNCKSSVNKLNNGSVLSGCLQQCKVDFVKIVNNVATSVGAPVFTMDGNFYLASSGFGIFEIDLKNKTSSILVTPSVGGFRGKPTGAQSDPYNNIWVADQRLGLLKVFQNGAFHQIATKDSKNDPIQGFSDLIFDYRGNLWITAPVGPIAPHAFKTSKTEPFGSVYCYKRRTGELIKVSTGYVYPNGIAVKHDENGTPMKLIFGVNKDATLWSFDIVDHCQIENKTVWGNLPANSIPSGMDFDEDGDLIVADYNTGHLYVFGPKGGAPIREIKSPFMYATNVHFRPDSKELYITENESHSLWKIQWKSKGMEQYCERPQRSHRCQTGC